MRYTINGEMFDNAAAVIETFGGGDYSDADWAEIADDGLEAVREGNLAAFPDLSDEDQDALAYATIAYAQDRIDA